MTWFFTLGFIVGGLNLLQLIPLLPLDGGQTLRAVMQSLHAVWARRAMLGLGGLGMIGFAISGQPLLAGVVALGGLQAWHLSKDPSRSDAMSWAGIAAMLVGYALLLIIHAAATYLGVVFLQFIY